MRSTLFHLLDSCTISASPKPSTSRKIVTMTVYSSVNTMDCPSNGWLNTSMKFSGKFQPRLPPIRLQREQAITTSNTMGTKNNATIITQSGNAYSRPRRVASALAFDFLAVDDGACLETLVIFSPHHD
ncbi:MAG: hypothetical protein ACLUUF_03200 [Bifidobacterium pullorum]